MRLIQNRAIKNASWIIGCKIVQAVLTLVVTMLSARYLGPSYYGILNYAASVTAFMVPVMQLGLRNTLVQEFVDLPGKEGETLGSALVMNLISAAACIISIICFTFIVNRNDPTVIIVCSIYSLNLIFQALEMTQYWFQSKLLSKYSSVVMLAAYVIASACQLYLLFTKKSIYWFAAISSLEFSIIAITLIVIYHKKNNQRLHFSLNRAKEMLHKSRHFIVANMMVTIFAQTDRIMLMNMSNDENVGYYAAAITCANMTSFVFYAIMDSGRPLIFESKKKSVDEYEKNMTVLYSVVIYLSLLQCVVITVCAPLVIRIIYGIEFMNAVNVLRILVWYTTFSYLGTVRNIWILAENKQNKLWIINGLGACLNVILNLLFIPLMQAHGAALASLITQIFTNVVLCFIMKDIRKSSTLLVQGLNIKKVYKAILK